MPSSALETFTYVSVAINLVFLLNRLLFSLVGFKPFSLFWGRDKVELPLAGLVLVALNYPDTAGAHEPL